MTPFFYHFKSDYMRIKNIVLLFVVDKNINCYTAYESVAFVKSICSNTHDFFSRPYRYNTIILHNIIIYNTVMALMYSVPIIIAIIIIYYG